MIRINNIKLSIDEPESYLVEKITKKLKINRKDLKDYKIHRKSLDARKELVYIYSIDAVVENEYRFATIKDVKMIDETIFSINMNNEVNLKSRPVIVGFGPSGMFAGLLLALYGFNPIIIERGECVEKRSISVQKYWDDNILNTESNVQFGEGGAGTFSDGKLTTRVKDIRGKYVLSKLVEFGAPESILYESNPHIGTDVLRNVVKNLRKEIQRLGGEIHFESKLTDFAIKNNKVSGIQINNSKTIDTSLCIVAIGHSARDTFELLYNTGFKMYQKPFAVGVRIEHPQWLINKIQYKDKKFAELLPPAEYKLVHQSSTKRAVYSFCMCPGGVVVGSASEADTIVTNGMSYRARDLENANSALVVQVDQRDFKNCHPLAGMYYQRDIEKKAFELAQKTHRAPAMLVGEFIKNQELKNDFTLNPSYTNSINKCDITSLFSDEIVISLKEAILEFDKKMPGFANHGSILTAPETRTSSPVRFLRNQDFQSNINGVYFAGEGAGYAGGIMSAAIDGVKIAESIITKFKPEF